MKKPRLYLFTSEFPYGKQETFLESELKYLSDYFTVTILPRSIRDSSRRQVQEGIIVSEDLASFGRKRRYTKAFGWTNPSFWVLLFQEWRMLSTLQALKRINTFAVEYAQTYNYLKANPINGKGILYSYWLNGVATALADYKFRCNKLAKPISRAHRYDIYEDLYKPEFWPERKKTIERLDKIFIISKDGFNYIQNKYGISDKVELSRLGVNKVISNTIKSDENVIKFLSISNLSPVKRVPLISKYLKQFSIDNPMLNIFWDHYGDGIDQKIIERELENSPGNMVVRIIGRIANLKLLESLSHENYDMLINTSISEGVPVSMMEAISFGIPILATNVGGVSEIVNERTGCLIQKDFDYETFSEKIIYIINNFSKNFQRRLEIISFWDANFSAQQNYAEFVNKLISLYGN